MKRERKIERKRKEGDGEREIIGEMILKSIGRC